MQPNANAAFPNSTIGAGACRPMGPGDKHRDDTGGPFYERDSDVMLGWLLNRRSKAMARLIHEMSCYAFDMNSNMGASLTQFFKLHPMRQQHRPPPRGAIDQIHRFLISDGKNILSIMVREGDDQVGGWLSIAPQGDFDGVLVQANAKGRYIVRFEAPLSRPAGRLAPKLVQEFVRSYDAVDVTV